MVNKYRRMRGFIGGLAAVVVILGLVFGIWRAPGVRGAPGEGSEPGAVAQGEQKVGPSKRDAGPSSTSAGMIGPVSSEAGAGAGATATDGKVGVQSIWPSSWYTVVGATFLPANSGYDYQ